jgi:hypothetical protein
MISEFHYKLEYEISLGSLTDLDEEVYLPIIELSSVITFIDNQVIPTLQALPLDLDLAINWNIGSSLEAFLMNQGGFFEKFAIDDIEQDKFYVDDLLDKFNRLRVFFQDAINQNIRYTVSIA